MSITMKISDTTTDKIELNGEFLTIIGEESPIPVRRWALNVIEMSKSGKKRNRE